ncbi:MAG: sensor histidine kinase [Halolamina sp.]
MPTHGSFGSRLVLVVGDDDRADALVNTLEADGVNTAHVETAPEALATLDSLDVGFLVVVDGVAGRPSDFFGAAAQKGHLLPGVFVGSKSRQLPPGIDQVPATVEAAAAAVRQRLLAEAATDAEPITEEDPLEAFGSTVSHELRNHLSAARLAVESLEGPTTDQALAAIDRLQSLASEAEAIAAKEVNETEPVSFSDAAAEAVDRVRVDEDAVEIDAEGSIEADPALLTLMLENLIRNATEHGGEDVTVRVVGTDEGFAVVDTGPGFDEENPFAWGYTTGEGQGAGLAMVRRIATAHGWEVAASNDDGARVDVVI